jgi:hypothetical protein
MRSAPERGPIAQFETVPFAELKHRLPANLMPLVEEYKKKLARRRPRRPVDPRQGDDAKDLRRAFTPAAEVLNRRIRFPFRGEEGAVSFYLVKARGRRRRAEVVGGRKRRGRPGKRE